MWLSALAMACWLGAGLWSLRLAPPRAALARWGLVAVGIPLLGAVTFAHGPLPGLAGLALGTLVLAPVRPRRTAE